MNEERIEAVATRLERIGDTISAYTDAHETGAHTAADVLLTQLSEAAVELRGYADELARVRFAFREVGVRLVGSDDVNWLELKNGEIVDVDPATCRVTRVTS